MYHGNPMIYLKNCTRISVVWILVACGAVTHCIVLGLNALIVAPKMQLLNAMIRADGSSSSEIRELYNSVTLFGYVFFFLESFALLLVLAGIFTWILRLIGGIPELPRKRKCQK